LNYIEEKKELLTYINKAYSKGLLTAMNGNLSIRIGQDRMLITPSQIEYSSMREGDFVLIDLDGVVVEGVHNPSSEWQMHAILYKNLEDLNAIIHTHSTYATVFAVLNKSIPPILVEMNYLFHGSVEVCEFSKPGSEEIGLHAIEKIKTNKVCLLQNHGTLSAGLSLKEAYNRTENLEACAKIYLMSNLYSLMHN